MGRVTFRRRGRVVTLRTNTHARMDQYLTAQMTVTRDGRMGLLGHSHQLARILAFPTPLPQFQDCIDQGSFTGSGLYDVGNR